MADLIDREELLCALYQDCRCMNTRFLNCVRQAPAVNRWIPCSERLTEDNCYTLVAVLFDEIYEVYIAAFRGDGWHTVEGYVTHWMPMPEPPEGGERRCRTRLIPKT